MAAEPRVELHRNPPLLVSEAACTFPGRPPLQVDGRGTLVVLERPLATCDTADMPIDVSVPQVGLLLPAWHPCPTRSPDACWPVWWELR